MRDPLRTKHSLGEFLNGVHFTNPELADQMDDDAVVVARNIFSEGNAEGKRAAARLRRSAGALPEGQRSILDDVLTDFGY